MRLGKSLYDAKQATLRNCPICSSLKPDSLETIAAMAQEIVAGKGEYLVTEGEPCNGFYLVLSGRVRVFKTSASGREKALLIAERGATFGEDALFGQGVFLENAVALEESKVLRIPRQEFLSLIQKNPELAFQVMESLCGWIRRLSASVENVVFLGAKDKVIRYLLERSRSSSNPHEFDLVEKKKDIADRLGITPETFSRVLHDLEQRKICHIHGKQVQIMNLASLEDE